MNPIKIPCTDARAAAFAIMCTLNLIESDERQFINQLIVNHLNADYVESDILYYAMPEGGVFTYRSNINSPTPGKIVYLKAFDRIMLSHGKITIFKMETKTEQAGNCIKDDADAIQAYINKGNKMNEQKNESITETLLTPSDIKNMLVQKGVSEAAACTIEGYLMRYGFSSGVPGAEVFGDRFGVGFNYGKTSRYYNSPKKTLDIGDQYIRCPMGHEGGVFHVSRKAKSDQVQEVKGLLPNRLMSAGLTSASCDFIIGALFNTVGLTPPTDHRQVIVLNKNDTLEVAYSNNGKAVFVDDDYCGWATLSDGTVIKGNFGTQDAYFVIQKKKELTKKELFEKHVGSLDLRVATPKGSCVLPYVFDISDTGCDGVKLTVKASLEFFFKDGVLHNSEGPAYTSFGGEETYYLDGRAVTKEAVDNRMKANKGTWKDADA
jgi:hypothetical protein